MRKLFTQLFSILLLNMVFVISGIGAPADGFWLTTNDDLDNHKKAEALVLTAPEKVVPGTGVIRLKDGVTTLAAYQATSSNVSITAGTDGKYKVAVNFSSFLVEDNDYTLEVDPNFILADDGSPANTGGSWTVLVGDFTAPVLATTGALAPANGATSGVQLNNTLVVKFNEPVQLANDAELYIYKDNGTSHGDLFDVVNASDVVVDNTAGVYSVTITPNKLFAELTKYYVTIPDGAIVDYNEAPYTDNKNKFAGWLESNKWAFSTRDGSAPTIVDIMPDNIAATTFDVFTKLNEKGFVHVLAVANDYVPVAGDFTTANGVKVAEVTDPAVAVKVSLTQFYNGATNSMVTGGDYDVWVLTETKDAPTVKGTPVKKLDVKTIDVIAPTAFAFYPVNGAEAPLNTKNNIYVVLSEDGKIGTGSVDIYTWSISQNHTLLVSVPASSLTVKNTTAVNGDTLFIPVTKTLWASSTTYFVKFNEGVVTDLAGNKLAGINTTEAWKFTVKDFLVPTYTVVPANGTTNASEGIPQITITFNENVYKDGSMTPLVSADILGAITLKKGTNSVPMTVNSFDGKVIKLTIDAAAVTSTAAFELSIDTKKFFDAVGNVGTTVDVINFSLKDYQGPVVTIEPVSAGTSDNILVKFNEPVLNANGSAVTNTDVANMVIFRKGTDASGAIVSATYSVASDAKSFIIDPTNDFTTPGDQYYVRLGAGAVKDAAGNSNLLATQIVTVKDFIAPTAEITGIGAAPINPGTVAPVITFSEPMETLAGTAVPTSGSANSYINLKEGNENIAYSAVWGVTSGKPTITITAAFVAGKTYTLSVGKSLQDAADNLFQGVSKTFTTWSDAEPAVVTLKPAKDATEQANDAAIEVTFDQNITLASTPGITVIGSSTGDKTGTATVTGAVLKIAHTAFDPNETVTVTIPVGAVIGVNTVATTEVITWSFKTKDTNAPTATYSPNTSGTALNSKLTIVYNENVVKKVGTIYIKYASNDVTVQTLSEANCVLKSDNKTLEITPLANFDYNKQYYVVVTEGLVEDPAGNKSAAVTGTGWNFTTVVDAGPFTVSSSNPANEADKVAAGINPITVTFNRDIKVGSQSSTAKITLKDITTTPVIVIDDAANTGRFSYSGAVLTIDTKTDIVAGKKYELTINTGIVTDNFNTPNTSKVIVFYTYDNNGPKVISHTPVKDATNVLTSTNVVLNWDETPLMLDGSGITAAKIKGSSAANALVTVNGSNAYTASIDGLQWTLSMDAPFSQKTTYSVTVKQDLVKDAAGNSRSEYSWSFTTADTKCDAPALAVAAGGNVEGTKVVLDVTNTQTDVYASGEKVLVYYTVLPATATPPTANEIIAVNTKREFTANGVQQATVTGLTSGVAYKAYAVAVDGSENKSTVASVAFTTADVVAPVVTALTPVNGATGVAANTTLKLAFNETVIIGTGSVVIREVATDIIVGTVVVAGGNTVITTTDGKSVAEITTGLTLASKTAYYAEVSSGTFEDLAGNIMESISGIGAWSFTTKDTVLPTLVKTTPAHDAATTPVIVKGSTLSIEFNEAMTAPTTGTVYVRYASNGNVFEVVNAAGLIQSADKKTFSFNMVNVPVEQAEFWVDLSSIEFTDLAGNKWTDVIGTTWNFIIKDQTPPALLSSTPANNATDVEIANDIVLTFTEGIFKSPDATAFTATTIKDVIALKTASGTAVAYTATLTNVVAGGVVTVTLNPDANLTSETVYKVYISPVVDVLKNVSSEIVVTFTTKDNTAPVVSAWTPAINTQCNPKTGVVTVTFSEPVYDEVELSTTEGNKVIVEVKPENIPSFFNYNVGTVVLNSNNEVTSFTAGAAVSFTGAISADKKTITLTPASSALPLGSELWYRVELIAGKVEDIANNANAYDKTIFRIEDQVKPIATYTPNAPAGAIDPDGDLKIAFSEKVTLGTGNVYIRNYVNGEVIETIEVNSTNVTLDDAGMVATIAHADLPAAMNFYATADAGTFADASCKMNAWDGIATSAIDTWKFSTADAVPPVVIAGTGLYPVPGATNVAMNTRIEITFDKEIQLNNDAVTRWVIIYNDDWTPFQVIPVNSSTVEIKANTEPVYQANRIMSINHNTLEANSIYHVRVMPGVVKDAAGNLFAGIMDDSWYFSTEDDGAPKVVTLTPADNATVVSVNTQLQILFDRSVVANAAGKIKLYKEMGPNQLGTLIETIDPTSSSVVVDERTVTVTLADKLLYETGYYVIVDAGSFTNTSASKIPFGGITTTQGWNFTTAKQNCEPVALTTSVVDQLECSAVVKVEVETEAPAYLLTVNGDTIEAGELTLASGIYEFVVVTEEGCAPVKDTLEIEGSPLVVMDTVTAYIGEEVHYMNEEAGIDTMLTVGVHTFEYVYEECARTLVVTVVEDVRTPKIAEIQGTSDESPLKDKLVKVVGTVSGVAAGEGFFIQDANAAWSGIWVEYSQTTYDGIQIGNGVEVTGTVDEIGNVTTIVADGFTFIPPVITLAPVVVEPSEIAAEKYESVLVKVEGARGTEANTAGEWTIYYLEANKATVNDWLYAYTPVADHYFDVTGVVNGKLDNFRIEPRIESDVKDLTKLTPIDPEQSVEFKVYPNPFNDHITLDNNDRLTRVVVVNVAGQRVIDIQYPEREIRTANLVSGVYVISLYTENGIAKTERIIKR